MVYKFLALFWDVCILRLAISTHVYFAKNVTYFPFKSWLSFQRLCRLLLGFKWGKRWRWGFAIEWHQLDHTQTICTSLQTDDHTNTCSSLNFYGPDALRDAQTTASKHWRTKPHVEFETGKPCVERFRRRLDGERPRSSSTVASASAPSPRRSPAMSEPDGRQPLKHRMQLIYLFI